MKKSVTVLSLILSVSVALSSCTASNGELKLKELFDADGQKIINCFGNDYSYKTILDDLKNLDMNHEPSYASLSHTSALNQDDGTIVHQYFDGDKLVYQVYENYGEEGFTYYTESTSGKELEVSYYTEDGKINSVNAKSECYSVLFENLNAKKPCGAEKVNITATKNGNKDIPETISYQINGKYIFLSNAEYFEDGEYKFYTSDIEKNKISSVGKGIKFEKCKSEPDAYTTNMILNEKNSVAIQTVLGKHVFKYKDTDKGMKWFVQCGIYLIFNTEEEARSFVAENNLKLAADIFVGSAYSVSDKYYVEFRDMTFAIADGFEYSGKAINEFIFEEFDDKTFADISFNADGEITALNGNNSILSVY